MKTASPGRPGLVGARSQATDISNPLQIHMMTDFSWHLGDVIESNDDDDYINFNEVTALPVEDDLYGWEAELERKLATEACFRYRRANGGTKNMVRRVFSLGQPSPSSDSSANTGE